MVSQWRTVTFGEVVRLEQGLCFNKKTNHLMAEKGIPLLRIADLVNNTQTKFVDEERVPKKFIAYPQDIIYSRTGQVGLVFKGKFGVVHNNCFRVIPQEGIERDYVYWYLRQPSIIQKARSLAGGAAQPDLGHDAFKSISFTYPELEIQRRIVGILSAYDDLIENNTRRIKILEEMAQALYREWFVKFQFPGHEKVKIEKSTLGKIPDGWIVANLSDLVDFIRGVEPGSRSYLNQYSEDTVQFLRVGDLGSRDSKIFIPLNLSNDKLLDKTDIALTLDGTVGIVKFGLSGCYSTGIRKVVILDREKLVWSFLYCLLKSEHIQEIIKAHARGTTIIHAGSAIEEMKFVLPPIYILDNFENNVSVLLKSMLNLQDKNANLRRTRDLLLPKLISGEVDVEKIDVQIPENGGA